MSRNIRLTRSLAIIRLQHQLERDSFPHLQMGFIVALTGAAGWLCSFVLLHMGVNSMALRYPLALAGAYVAFLFLLWLWLRSTANDYADLPDLTDLTDLAPQGCSGPSPTLSSLDADELAIPLIAIALALGLALASLYVVYLAPTLFAELLFDGVLSYTLYRRLRTTDSSHWLGTAFRRTVIPFGLTAVFLVAVGAAMAAYAPHAHSLGEVLRHHNNR